MSILFSSSFDIRIVDSKLHKQKWATISFTSSTCKLFLIFINIIRSVYTVLGIYFIDYAGTVGDLEWSRINNHCNKFTSLTAVCDMFPPPPPPPNNGIYLKVVKNFKTYWPFTTIPWHCSKVLGTTWIQTSLITLRETLKWLLWIEHQWPSSIFGISDGILLMNFLPFNFVLLYYRYQDIRLAMQLYS